MMPVVDNTNNTAANAAFTVNQMENSEIRNLAGQFVVQYYTVMKKCPSGIHRFYKDDSTMIHDDTPIYGQRKIHEKIIGMRLQDCRIAILRLDALQTSGNSVLVQVHGEISTGNEQFRRFTQTFVLREQAPFDFYVRNDIFRFQDFVYGDVKSNEVEINNVQMKKSDVVENTTPPHPVIGGDKIEHMHSWREVTEDVAEVNNHETIIEQNNVNHIAAHAPSPPQNDFINPPQPDGVVQMASAPTQQRSWAQMVSKQPPSTQNIQPNKPFRPSAPEIQAPDEQLRVGVKQSVSTSHPNQRLRGAGTRQGDFRSVSDGNYGQDNRGSNRGGSIRGSARGGRGNRGGQSVSVVGQRRGN